jgi:hypothetical protein
VINNAPPILAWVQLISETFILSKIKNDGHIIGTNPSNHFPNSLTFSGIVQSLASAIPHIKKIGDFPIRNFKASGVVFATALL